MPEQVRALLVNVVLQLRDGVIRQPGGHTDHAKESEVGGGGDVTEQEGLVPQDLGAGRHRVAGVDR